MYRNLMATFILGGLWHGAGWTFIFWGFLHGLALGFRLNSIVAWFINIAKEWDDAIKVLRGIVLPNFLSVKYGIEFVENIQGGLIVPIYILLVLSFKNSNEVGKDITSKKA